MRSTGEVWMRKSLKTFNTKCLLKWKQQSSTHSCKLVQLPDMTDQDVCILLFCVHDCTFASIQLHLTPCTDDMLGNLFCGSTPLAIEQITIHSWAAHWLHILGFYSSVHLEQSHCIPFCGVRG